MRMERMKMPHVRAIRATLRSLESSTDVWITTAEYTVEASGWCSPFISHRTLKFEYGNSNLGRNVCVSNRKHGILLGHCPENFPQAAQRFVEYGSGLLPAQLVDVYRDPQWVPAMADEERPLLEIIDGVIPYSWTYEIWGRLGLESPLEPPLVWACTLRPALAGFVDVGENGEFPVADEYAVTMSRPVFWGSELWAKIRREQNSQDDESADVSAGIEEGEEDEE